MLTRRTASTISDRQTDTRNTAEERILEVLRKLVQTHDLQPGGRLPSENSFHTQYGFNRHQVRQTVEKLAVYGVVRIVPQSGTYLANVGPKALDSMIHNLLSAREPDFESLAETRKLLEPRAAALAAEHATDQELTSLREKFIELREQVSFGRRGLDEDYVLHLEIARLSKDPVLTSLIGIIVPKSVAFSQSVLPETSDVKRATKEHDRIVSEITSREAVLASEAMREHLDNTMIVTAALLRSQAISFLDSIS